jgi:opacity protein-like surface antigen
MYGRGVYLLGILAIGIMCITRGTIVAQAEGAVRADLKLLSEEEKKKKSSTGAESGGDKLGVEMSSRNPLEAGVNVCAITARSFVEYNQVDINGGIFFPVGDLAEGMDLGYFFGLNIRTPFTHLVLPSKLGIAARHFAHLDVGLHFSYLTGESSRKSSDVLSFAPMLLDVYYTPPLDTGRFKVYMFIGAGLSLTSTVVVRNAATVHDQSFDLAVRPGAGAEYFFSDRVYARINAGYFICFETVTAMGLITSLGVGYLY